jgi:hydrogenase maturation protease
MSAEDVDTLVLGIGNILWADEGFGVRCVEAMNARFKFDDDVRVMDGGTQGLFLLPWVCSASRLLIFDAIDFGLAPGELRVIKDDDVPQYMGARKVSMHQTGFQEVLMSARLLRDDPQQIVLIGVQPEQLDDYGGSLRARVRKRIPEAVELGCAVLRQWGLAVHERSAPLESLEQIGRQELSMPNYELGKPQ